MIPTAVYCRVSTDHLDQANSFASQQRYFREYIERQEDLQLYAIYADEGLSGTDTKKRIRFHDMVRDAEAGKFQLILTKEVSRFSRNLLDTISYTRKLKQLGVTVRFMSDGIDTAEPDAELRLSIMASIAQEESRKTSDRVVWGQTRRMEQGVVFGRSLLGYHVRHGRLEIEPQGAEIVQRIFRAYALEQQSCGRIAERLRQEGRNTSSGSDNWTAASVLRILKNEKYVGDLVQKKTYTPDYLTHAKRMNRGEVPFIVQTDHHVPIIDRELWNMTQQRLQEKGVRRGCSVAYPLSGKIFCGACGSVFAARQKYRKDGSSYIRWQCSNRSCTVGKLLRDDDAMQMIEQVLQYLIPNPDQLHQQIFTQWKEVKRNHEEALLKELMETERKTTAALDGYCAGILSCEEFHASKARYQEKQLQLHVQLRSIRQMQLDEALLQPSERLYRCLLDRITVFPDRHMELRLIKLSETTFIFR